MAKPKRKPRRFAYGKTFGVALLGYSSLDGLRLFLLGGWNDLDFLYHGALFVVGLALLSLSYYFEKRWERNPFGVT